MVALRPLPGRARACCAPISARSASGPYHGRDKRGRSRTERLTAAVTNTPSAWGKSTPLWHDWVAGTNPDPAGTNATLRITEIAPGEEGVVRLRWTPDLGDRRIYTVWGCTDLDVGDWHSPTNSADRFFKVKVSLPPDG